MTISANKVTQWTVYDAKVRTIHQLTNEEFKNLLLDRPHKIVGKIIPYRGHQIWIDCILNSSYFK